MAVTRWLFSTNAKDIGTLYLIFAVFSGFAIQVSVLAIGFTYLGYALDGSITISHVPQSWDDFTLVIHSIYNAATVIISSLSADYIDLRDSMVRTFYITNSSMLTLAHVSYTDTFNSNTAIDYAVSSLASTSISVESLSLAGQLGPYLAGLLESDGSFSTPSMLSSNTPTIYISFNLARAEFPESPRP